jgi:hypothetical protein
MKMTIGMGVFGFGQVVVEVDKAPRCPQCGEPVSDEGSCLISFALTENMNTVAELKNRAPFVLSLNADCRSCNYYGPGPTLDFFSPFQD